MVGASESGLATGAAGAHEAASKAAASAAALPPVKVLRSRAMSGPGDRAAGLRVQAVLTGLSCARHLSFIGTAAASALAAACACA